MLQEKMFHLFCIIFLIASCIYFNAFMLLWSYVKSPVSAVLFYVIILRLLYLLLVDIIFF